MIRIHSDEGESEMTSNEWVFDQGPNVAALTTRQVVDLNYPVRQVVHYGDDHSWAFMCGTTEDSDDYMLVHMEDVLIRDESLRSLADLPPGWLAWRVDEDSAWQRQVDDSPGD